MKPISLGRLISLGQSARFLQDARKGWAVHGGIWITGNIDRLLSDLENLKFKVTLQAADDLRRIRREFDAYPADTKVSVADEKRLRDIMRSLRATMRAESRTLQAYLLTEKRLDVGRLVTQPESFLGEGTYTKLPGIAKFDIREAGRCIAFEAPTAAAFHLLRATEDALRSYYRVFFKRGPGAAATWGALVHGLRGKRRKPRPDETLLNHLDHIRKNFRNPTDHPEMVYDTDGVQDLFSLAVDVLNRIAKELPEAKEPATSDLIWHFTSSSVDSSPSPLPLSEELGKE